MTDLITAEEAQRFLHGTESGPVHWAGLEYFREYARAVIALHAQLADAQAAQAMWIEALESDLLDRVIEGIVWSMPEGTRATDEWRRGVTDARRDITAAVKLTFLTLAPIDGLALVRGLRAEIADLSLNMDADLKTMVREGEQLRTLAAENQRLRDRERVLVEALASRLTANERRVLFTLVNEGVHRNEVGSEKSIQWLRRNGLIERDGGIASKLGGSSVAYWSYVMTDLGNMVHAAIATDAEKAGGV